jgi:hypothetical protein
MAYNKQTWVDEDPTKPLSAARMGYMESGIEAAANIADSALQTAQGAGSGTLVGAVALDSFTGSTDDAKLTNALSYVASQTVKPPILFGNRQYTFSQAGRTVFSGMKLVGPYAHGNQQRSANSIPNDIRWQGTGTWWQLAAGNVFDVGLYGLSFQGNSSSQFMATGSSVLWTSVFRDLGFNLWKHVLGNPTAKFLNTAVLFDGWWNTNNAYNTSYTMGGSDSNLWMDGMLMDSPQSIKGNMGSAYHMRFDYQEKSTVGPLFITADRVSGIHILGNDGNAALIFQGQGRCEGRNANTPCYGSNIRIDGGGATFRDWEIFYGYSSPANSGHTGEGGVITVTGGRAMFDGVWYDRATGQAENSPFIYQSGGFVRVRNVMTGSKGASWSTVPGKPAVRSVGGTLDADSSVVVL